MCTHVVMASGERATLDFGFSHCHSIIPKYL